MPRRLLSLCCVLAALWGCSAMPRHFDAANVPPAVLVPAAKAGVTDGRGRFREIFEAVSRTRGERLPDPRSGGANSALWRLDGEPAPTGRPVELAPSRAGLTVLLVPGLLAECVRDKSMVFEDAVPNLEAQGYATASVRTRGRQSSERNAAIIREAVLAVPEPARIVLLTHSKGAVDSLEALAAFPELARRVLAVVSVSGAVNGSPLADVVPEVLAGRIERLRLSQCPPGDGVEAMDSLRRAHRLAWLASHRLPAGVRTYSLAAFALPADMSAVLKPFYAILAHTDPLNDGLVLCSDAMLPDATLLGYPNADHLAVAMPFPAAKTPILAATCMTRNRYPRAVLAEAVLRYVEEDLRAHGTLPADASPAGDTNEKARSKRTSSAP